MTAPILTCLPSLEITDPRVAALFVKPHVAGYLAQFIGMETTVKRAALHTGTKLNVMAYWAARFLALGLIGVTRTERRGGSAVKHYRSVAEEFVLATTLLEGLSSTELLQHIMARHYDQFSRNVAEVGQRLTPDWRLRLFRDDGGYGLHLEPVAPSGSASRSGSSLRPLHDWADVALTAEDAASFRRELGDLFERFRTSRHHGPNLRRYVMHAGFVEDLEHGRDRPSEG